MADAAPCMRACSPKPPARRAFRSGIPTRLTREARYPCASHYALALSKRKAVQWVYREKTMRGIISV